MGGHRSSAEGASIEAPQAPRGVGFGEGVSPSPMGGRIPLPIGEGSGKEAMPLPRNFFDFQARNAAFCGQL